MCFFVVVLCFCVFLAWEVRGEKNWCFWCSRHRQQPQQQTSASSTQQQQQVVESAASRSTYATNTIRTSTNTRSSSISQQHHRKEAAESRYAGPPLPPCARMPRWSRLTRPPAQGCQARADQHGPCARHATQSRQASHMRIWAVEWSVAKKMSCCRHAGEGSPRWCRAARPPAPPPPPALPLGCSLATPT